MAYAVYTTEAIVCGSKHRNTADISYQLYTRNLGMLYAEAKSVRQERSRQRYALQDFSLLRVSLVKGRHQWRVGSIEPVNNFYAEATSREARGSVVKLCRFIKRFVGGEQASESLFDNLQEALTVLSGDTKHRSFVELVIMVNILSRLGYVSTQKLPEYVKDKDLSEIDQQYDPFQQKQLLTIYNKAVEVSHL